jgi:hypothetical protein
MSAFGTLERNLVFIKWALIENKVSFNVLIRIVALVSSLQR